MATVISGDSFGVYVKVGLDWLLAVCTSSISVDRTRNSIEFQNNCTAGSVGKLATTQNNSISFEGDISVTPGAGEIGFVDLDAQFDASTVSEWKIENADSSIVYYTPTAFIESFTGSFPTGDKATFSISLAVSGDLETSVPS